MCPVQARRESLGPARIELGRGRRVLSVTIWILAAALLASLVWTTRFGSRWPSVYFMTGASMEPTVAMEEYFLAWSPPGKLRRGDLVIFRFEDEDGVFHVLRRLAGLGGDTVSMRAGTAIVNGAPQRWPFRIIEPDAWRSAIARSPNLYDWGPWVVPADSVFLLADTRDVIGWPDSRFIGYVARDDILARAGSSLKGLRLPMRDGDER